MASNLEVMASNLEAMAKCLKNFASMWLTKLVFGNTIIGKVKCLDGLCRLQT